MGRIDENQLKKQLREKTPDRLYFLYGSEDYVKQHYASFIPQRLVEKEFEAFNLHRFDGKTVTFDELSDSVSSLPMMGEFACTVVHDMNLIDLLPKQKDEEEEQAQVLPDSGRFETLIEIISDIPESTVLVFWMDAVTVDEKNAKWIKIVKTFEKYGTVIKLDRLATGELVKQLCTGAEKRGCTLEKTDALYMINIAGDELGTLRNEIDKVCAYKKSGKITRADIDSAVTVSPQARIFSLAKQIIDKKADEALYNLDALLKQREEPIKLLAVLAGPYVDMLRVKAAVQSGMKCDAVAADYPVYKKNKMFMLENAAASSRKYSIDQLREAILYISKADTDLKSTGTDKRVILETLIINLLRI